jgi:hypothetical protein
MESPTNFGVDLVFLQFSYGQTSTSQIHLLKFLFGINITTIRWLQQCPCTSPSCLMMASSWYFLLSICKPKRFLNSTLYNGNMKILRTIICLNSYMVVDRIFTWVQIKKNTQGRPNECQIVYLGITIKLIDRSQGNYNEIRTTFLNELAFKGVLDMI